MALAFPNFPFRLGMQELLMAIEACGIVAFAFSGFVEARRKEMDMVGIFTIGFITAFGGGTLRDLLLDQRPLFWVENHEYVLLIFVLAFLVAPLSKMLSGNLSEKVIVTADALGLGSFAALATLTAFKLDMPWFVCVMMGVITGIFGGVLRDVICNEIPMVFRRGQLYATCAFLGGWVCLGLIGLGVAEAVALLTAILITCGMRLLAVRFDWRLPG